MDAARQVFSLAPTYVSSPELRAQHNEARAIVKADPQLSPVEITKLFVCIAMRQQDRAFWEEMTRRAAADARDAQQVEQDFIDYCNNSWWPNAVLFRWRSGDMFASSRDYQARNHRDRHIREQTAERNSESRMHKRVVEGEEARMRFELQPYSHYTKRLFNIIAIARHTTANHFSENEIDTAASSAHPLENVFRRVFPAA